MQEKTKDLLTSAQRFSLYIIAVTFIILIWRMISLGVLLKVCLLCISGVFVFSLILQFPDNYGYVRTTLPSGLQYWLLLLFFFLFLYAAILSMILIKKYISNRLLQTARLLSKSHIKPKAWEALVMSEANGRSAISLTTNLLTIEMFLQSE